MGRKGREKKRHWLAPHRISIDDWCRNGDKQKQQDEVDIRKWKVLVGGLGDEALAQEMSVSVEFSSSWTPKLAEWWPEVCSLSMAYV